MYSTLPRPQRELDGCGFTAEWDLLYSDCAVLLPVEQKDRVEGETHNSRETASQVLLRTTRNKYISLIYTFGQKSSVISV